jgi:hypothetical protein
VTFVNPEVDMIDRTSKLQFTVLLAPSPQATVVRRNGIKDRVDIGHHWVEGPEGRNQNRRA